MNKSKSWKPLQVPSTKTLRRYGLTRAEWLDMAGPLELCHVCKKRPPSGRLVVDHEHVPGWKKMPPGQRRTYVRGLCDWICNARFLSRGMSLTVAKNLVDYFLRYHGVTISDPSP